MTVSQRLTAVLLSLRKIGAVKVHQRSTDGAAASFEQRRGSLIGAWRLRPFRHSVPFLRLPSSYSCAQYRPKWWKNRSLWLTSEMMMAAEGTAMDVVVGTG